MHNTTIVYDFFLFPYNHDRKQKPQDVQQMTYSHSNKGPYYLNKTEAAGYCCDKIVGTKKEKYKNLN